MKGEHYMIGPVVAAAAPENVAVVVVVAVAVSVEIAVTAWLAVL